MKSIAVFRRSVKLGFASMPSECVQSVAHGAVATRSCSELLYLAVKPCGTLVVFSFVKV